MELVDYRVIGFETELGVLNDISCSDKGDDPF